MRQINKYLPI